MVIEALVDQLEVDQRLVTDLGEELQRLPADLQQEEAGCEGLAGKSGEMLPPLLMVGAFRGTSPCAQAWIQLGLTPRLVRSQLWMRREGITVSSSRWQLSQ